MNPEQIIAGVNRENERLEQEVKRLRLHDAHLNDLINYYRNELQDREYRLYEGGNNIGILQQQNEYLKGQISFIERTTEGAIASSNSVIYLQGVLREAEQANKISHYTVETLSQATVQLQEAVARSQRQSLESEDKVRAYLSQISDLESQSLLNVIHKNESEKKLSSIKQEYRRYTTRAEELAKARDDLNGLLIKSNGKLWRAKRKDKKVLDAANNEKRRLMKEITEAEKKIQENEDKEAALQQQLKNEEILQAKIEKSLKENDSLQSRLSYYQSGSIKQQNVISSFKRQMEQLRIEERAQGFSAMIRHRDIEVEKLNEKLEEQRKFVEQKSRLVDLLLKKQQESVERMKDKEAEITRWKGNVLGYSFQSIDQIKADSIAIGKDITDNVFNLLKDISSQKDAKNAVSSISVFLDTADHRMNAITAETNLTRDNTIALVSNIRKLLGSTETPADFEKLIDDIANLRVGLQAEANNV